MQLTTYGILGRQVKTIVDENLAMGQHAFRWNGTDDLDMRVASGVYLVQFVSREHRLTQKSVLVY